MKTLFCYKLELTDVLIEYTTETQHYIMNRRSVSLTIPPRTDYSNRESKHKIKQTILDSD